MALLIVLPGTGLWVPAYTEHISRMPSGPAMRGLFLREDVARAGPDTVTVVAISPLLRALILAACEQPVMWDEDGRVRHVVALALHEIGHAATRPISVPACNDVRLQREPGRPARARRIRRDGWGIGADTGPAVPARKWHELSQLAATVAADRRAYGAQRRRDPGARRGCGRVQERPSIRRRVSIGIRHHTGPIATWELKNTLTEAKRRRAEPCLTRAVART
jgi:hypothetical protein